MAEAERAIPVAAREPSDVSERFVWGALALLFCSLLAIVLLVLWMFTESLLDRHHARATSHLSVAASATQSTRRHADLLCG